MKRHAHRNGIVKSVVQIWRIRSACHNTRCKLLTVTAKLMCQERVLVSYVAFQYWGSRSDWSLQAVRKGQINPHRRRWCNPIGRWRVYARERCTICAVSEFVSILWFPTPLNTRCINRDLMCSLIGVSIIWAQFWCLLWYLRTTLAQY